MLEACSKQLLQILKQIEVLDNDKQQIIEIKQTLEKKMYDLEKLPSYITTLRKSLCDSQKILTLSEKLSYRLDEIIKVVNDYDKSEVEKIFSTNLMAYNNVKDICDNVNQLNLLVESEIDKYYCYKVDILCKIDCQYRKDPKSWRYFLKYRWNSVLKRCKNESVLFPQCNKECVRKN